MPSSDAHRRGQRRAAGGGQNSGAAFGGDRWRRALPSKAERGCRRMLEEILAVAVVKTVATELTRQPQLSTSAAAPPPQRAWRSQMGRDWEVGAQSQLIGGPQV